MPKQRLDNLVVERGLVDSREQARRLILAAQVLVNGHPATKPGHKVDTASELLLKSTPRFVSRGGEKMEAAFETFNVDVEGLTCIDVGSSTGGFTDCLLQHGAAKVYAVDVGKGQLNWQLRNDPRVIVMEGVNARYLKKEAIPDTPSFAVADVSFISLTKVLPAVIDMLARGAELVTLIKPQFEAGRKQVQKGGVIKDPAVRQAVVEQIKEFGTQELRLQWLGLCESPIKGPAGNIEFLAWWRKA